MIGDFAHRLPSLVFVRNDRRGFDVIEVRETLFQVGIAFHLDLALVRSGATWRSFAIFPVDLVNHVHARGHFAEGRETLPVEAGIVAKVDEELRCARVGTGGGKGNRAAGVAALDRVIGNRGVAPFGGYRRIAVNPELAHETGDHAEKRDVLEKSGANQVVKTVGPVGGQRAGDRDGEFALGGVKNRLERIRRFCRELGGVGKTKRGVRLRPVLPMRR